jgi:hypothetical protein
MTPVAAALWARRGLFHSAGRRASHSEALQFE